MASTRRQISFFALSALALGPACIPWPHTLRTSPEMEGMLEAEGRPLSGATVQLNIAGESAAQTTTDAAGHFVFPAGTRFDFFVWFGDPMYSWEVAARSGDAQLSWRASAMGWVPLKQELVCQLPPAGPPACTCTEDSGSGNERGPCRSGHLQTAP